jgi:uncharacterized protein YqfB (UPF0267 family)
MATDAVVDHLMVAYSFKQQFAAPILAGTKRQTIRADRKRHARPGEELQLYTGMRTRQCALIARVTCASVTPIRIRFPPDSMIEFDDQTLRPGAGIDAFARLDGFPDWHAMKQFWWANHPTSLRVFTGMLIRWTLNPTPETAG